MCISELQASLKASGKGVQVEHTTSLRPPSLRLFAAWVARIHIGVREDGVIAADLKSRSAGAATTLLGEALKIEIAQRGYQSTQANMKLEVQQRLWVEMIEMMTTFRRLLDSRMSTLLQTQRSRT
mmetsp:Transcript_7659/g.16942  ORF Transcript_7659/g.16942 Transcript_7659/m.16942 type:complete len:125 (+) Transcript_7659:117-491(+)